MSRPDKRQDVMQAALEIIAEDGIQNAPTSAIAARAKVGMGTIYRYFKSKEELIQAIYDERLQEMRAFIMSDLSPGQTLKDRYIALCRRLFEYLVANPLDYKFFEQYGTSPYVDRTEQEMQRTFEAGEHMDDYAFFSVFSEGLQSGTFKKMKYPLLSALTFSPIMALAGQVLGRTVVISAETQDMLFTACWDALTKH